MNKRYNKRLNISVSEIGFGAWQLGSEGGNWDKMDYDYAVKLVRTAVEEGVTFFDTAPGYSNGQSEYIIGEALKDLRHLVHINTKIGHGPNGEYEFTKEGIKTSINRSLSKLKTNYIDTVILHNPERFILEGNTDLFKELQTYKDQGVIKGYGVSIDTLEELELVIENLDIDVIEIMFNIIHQEPRYLFDKVKEKGILVIAKIPFDSGWLTGRFDASSSFKGIRSRWNKETKEVRSNIVKRVQTIFNKNQIAQEALQYILSYDAITTVIPGTRTLEHLESNISASKVKMEQETKKLLEELYESYIKNQNTPW